MMVGILLLHELQGRKGRHKTDVGKELDSVTELMRCITQEEDPCGGGGAGYSLILAVKWLRLSMGLLWFALNATYRSGKCQQGDVSDFR